MAGFGSIITLAIYMDVMGIAGHVANGTNRVNILASTSLSAYTFHKNGRLDMSNSSFIIVLVVIGAVLGVLLATQLDADGFKTAFKYILIPILIVLVTNPKRFINPTETGPPVSKWLTIPAYLLLGVYAGFIQAGFGVLFLMIAVIMSKLDLTNSNALKVAIVGIYTIFVLAIFQYKGMVNWSAGLTLAVGQGIGGVFAAKNMSKYESANKWAYRILILIVFLVLVKNFEVWKWFV